MPEVNVKATFGEPDIKKKHTMKDADFLTWYVVEDCDKTKYIAAKTHSSRGSHPTFIYIRQDGTLCWSVQDGSEMTILDIAAELNIKITP